MQVICSFGGIIMPSCRVFLSIECDTPANARPFAAVWIVHPKFISQTGRTVTYCASKKKKMLCVEYSTINYVSWATRHHDTDVTATVHKTIDAIKIVIFALIRKKKNGMAWRFSEIRATMRLYGHNRNLIYGYLHWTNGKQIPNLKLTSVCVLLSIWQWVLFLFFLFLGTLKTLLSSVAPEKSVKEICQKGDDLLLEETSKVRAREKETCRWWFVLIRLCCIPNAIGRCSRKRRKSRKELHSQRVCRWTIAFAIFRQPKMTRTTCWKKAMWSKSIWERTSMDSLLWQRTQWSPEPTLMPRWQAVPLMSYWPHTGLVRPHFVSWSQATA